MYHVLEAAMPPAIGIGFLALSAILVVAYILFLAGQQRLQNNIARDLKRDADQRWHRGSTPVQLG